MQKGGCLFWFSSENFRLDVGVSDPILYGLALCASMFLPTPFIYMELAAQLAPACEKIVQSPEKNNMCS